MAEAGSFAEKVKQQADIVRVVGEYVRLKKSGQNFTGLCPFHAEKSPSFAVHPTKQIYHCFGCGVGGDVFKFVMEMEKCAFPEAIRIVAEKCGIAVPRQKERSPEERKENQQRSVLVEMHREAQTFFVKQLEGTLEGKAARAYLEDRGLDKDAISQFGIGYAPSGGDALLRHLKSKYNEKMLVESGLVSRDQSAGRLFDRFRRRITFPIAVARAGISNVVASCGTSLAEPQIKLLGRFTRRVVVNYDPDTAGQTATERSLSLLLEQDFEVRVLALPPVGNKKADPDLFIREKGADEYLKLLKEAPPYVDYLIARARQMDLTTGEGKLRAVNFLLPYVQKIPNRILRSEWATRIAQQLRLDEPVLRAALSKAASERRSELKTQPELVGRAAKPVERRLIRMLAEAEGFRHELAQRLQNARLYHGLETERIFAALVIASLAGQPLQATEVAAVLEERDRRLLFEILFEETNEPTWEEALSCIEALQNRQAERELAEVQRSIEASPSAPEMRGLLEKKQELMRRLAAAR